MGTCKDEMKPKSEKGNTLLGRFKRKTKKEDSQEQTLADLLVQIIEKAEKVHAIKANDLKKEKGKKEENQLKLAKINTILYHLNEVGELITTYSE